MPKLNTFRLIKSTVSRKVAFLDTPIDQKLFRTFFWFTRLCSFRSFWLNANEGQVPVASLSKFDLNRFRSLSLWKHKIDLDLCPKLFKSLTLDFRCKSKIQIRKQFQF